MKKTFLFSTLILFSCVFSNDKKVLLSGRCIKTLLHRCKYSPIDIKYKKQLKEKDFNEIEIEENLLNELIIRNEKLSTIIFETEFISIEIKNDPEKLKNFLIPKAFESLDKLDLLLFHQIFYQYVTPETLPKILYALGNFLRSENTREKHKELFATLPPATKMSHWRATDVAQIFEGCPLESLGLSDEDKEKVKNKSQEKVLIEGKIFVEGLLKSKNYIIPILKSQFAPIEIKNDREKLSYYFRDNTYPGGDKDKILPHDFLQRYNMRPISIHVLYDLGVSLCNKYKKDETNNHKSTSTDKTTYTGEDEIYKKEDSKHKSTCTGQDGMYKDSSFFTIENS